MGTQQVTTRSDEVQSIPGAPATPNYSRPLAIVTTLFFMWGFLTCSNDILVPHLKSIFLEQFKVQKTSYSISKSPHDQYATIVNN